MIESARGVHALLVQDVVDRKVIKQVRFLLSVQRTVHACYVMELDTQSLTNT